MGKKHLFNAIKTFVLNRLHLLKINELNLSPQTIQEFDGIYMRYILNGEGDWINYKSQAQKYLFLNYIIERKNVLVHGTNHSEIIRFEPRDQLLFNGKPTKAVFAASDGIWSLFFAIINRKDYVGSLRNACITAPGRKGINRYYYFSINKNYSGDYWTDGTIYILPKENFKKGGIRDEWICENDIQPLAKLAVKPDDFPFIEQVSHHKETDSLLKTIIKAILIK